MTTFRTMTVSDLGDNCTASDLEAFRNACIARQAETGESDAYVTTWMWGDGDWAARAAQYVEVAR